MLISMPKISSFGLFSLKRSRSLNNGSVLLGSSTFSGSDSQKFGLNFIWALYCAACGQCKILAANIIVKNGGGLFFIFWLCVEVRMRTNSIRPPKFSNRKWFLQDKVPYLFHTMVVRNIFANCPCPDTRYSGSLPYKRSNFAFPGLLQFNRSYVLCMYSD